MGTNFLFEYWSLYKFRQNFGQPYRPLRNLLYESQYWNEEQIKDYQNKQLAKLFNTISGINFYSKTIIKSGITNLDTANVTELGTLPKEIVKNEPEELFNSQKVKYKIHSTSGSSGDPLKIRVSLNAEAFRVAGRKRYYDWWGIKTTDRHVLIWCRSKYPTSPVTFSKRIKNFIIKKEFFINVFELSSDGFPNLIKNIKQYRPKYFRGYTSGIEQFADLCLENGICLNNLNLKGVIVTSEILYSIQREKIEMVFGCPVINEYGASDGGLIAFECPERSMHIFEEAILVNTTSIGDVLLTDLHNYAMPLINYELGDKIHLSEKNKCSCGRKLRIIDKIEGREGDYIQKSNGQRLSQYFFYYLIKDLDGAGFPQNITKYKVIQEGNVFHFYFVKGKSFSEGVFVHIKNNMLSEIGNDIEINFHSVTEIEREESGKLRFFIRKT